MSGRNIRDLLAGVSVRALGLGSVEVTGIAYRSGDVAPGDAFFCVPGFAHDGHDFAEDAIARGAVALAVERPLHNVDAPQFQVDDARRALAVAADAFFGEPSKALRVVGITGTNGKTTTTYLVDSILREAGESTGLTGTVETRIRDESIPAVRTTPESCDLQALLARMRDDGVSTVAMEVSSHAIDLHRVDAVRFAVAAFTNLTQDHLDYHSTIEEYFSVKRSLFTDFDIGVRVVNVDDTYGAGIAQDIQGCLTVGRSPEASVSVRDEDLSWNGSTFTLTSPNGARVINLPLAGAHNISNALVAAGCAIALDVDLDTIVKGLESAPQVPGRLERVECGQDFAVVVDYAHTPDSLEKAIVSVREVADGRVIVVFGCGGDRDPGKRPLMGRAAGEHSDYAVVTSDNPRSEDPVGIIVQIEDGLRDVEAVYDVEVDRRRAIARAFSAARPGDTVLIAGKGHEDYQIFADQTVHFDDREVAREELEARCLR